jgi:hypothetical protein
MADSFSISLLIFSCYFFWLFLEHKKSYHLILFGFAFTGSFFFRQISIVLAPLFLILLWQSIYKISGLTQFLKQAAIAFIVPGSLLLSWSLHNYNNSGRLIFLVKPINECCGAFTLERLKAGEVLNNWGLNMVHWRPESPGAWFYSKEYQTQVHPDIAGKATTQYNLDSILSLKNTYSDYRNSETESDKTKYGNQFVIKADHVINDFKIQHPWYVRIFSRIGLLYSFIFPVTIDNLPLPRRSQMNASEFMVKVFYFGLLISLNILAVVGSIYFFLYAKKINLYFLSIPWVLCLLLALGLGYIEQRYFAPIYPYFLIIAVIFTNTLVLRFSKSADSPLGRLLRPKD